jgi:hypothetical protein
MDPRRFWKSLVRIAFSLLCALVFYLVWMVAFLLTTGLESTAAETILWLLAPVITAAGFATGIAVRERLAGKARPRFLRIFLWALVGCVAGAGLAYPLGPMLAVFGMLAAGTASIALREVVGFFRAGQAARG